MSQLLHKRRHVTGFAVITAAVCLAACAEEISVEVETLSLPEPLVDQLPLTVGIHYTERFASYKNTIDQNVWIYNLSMGPANVDLFNQVLSSVFANVVPLTEPRYSLDQPPIPAIILEPSVTVNVTGGHGVIAGHPRYSVIYWVRFYEIDGEYLELWHVSGRAADLESAMRQAAARMLSELGQHPQISAALTESRGSTFTNETPERIAPDS